MKKMKNRNFKNFKIASWKNKNFSFLEGNLPQKGAVCQ